MWVRSAFSATASYPAINSHPAFESWRKEDKCFDAIFSSKGFGEKVLSCMEKKKKKKQSIAENSEGAQILLKKIFNNTCECVLGRTEKNL